MDGEQGLENILAQHTPDVRTVAEEVITLILASVPEASAAPRTGWHSVAFAHPTVGYFAGVFPRQDHVLLVFEFGVLLNDVDGVLEGSGSQVRQARLQPGEPIPDAALRQLLAQAISLPASRSVRLEMVRSRSS
jgi:hypothetical protein